MYISEGLVPCQVYDEEIWFSKKNSAREHKAKKLCGICPEKLACLSSTLRFEKRTGSTQPCVLGGLTESERAKLLSRRQPAAASTAA